MKEVLVNYFCFFLFLFIINNEKLISQNIFLADPTILEDNGKYFLYGSSSGGIDSTRNGFLIYQSNDLLKWEKKGYSLKRGDSYGDEGFWAPHVFKYGKNYCMVYVANENIALAFSKNPLGPFTNQLKTFIKSNEKMIDPYILFDKGIFYLYHVRRTKDGNKIYVAELEDDLNNLKKEGLTECLKVDNNWEDIDEYDNKSIQGPSVIKIENTFYMFYSANNFKSDKYAVGFAVSKSPLGPWKKIKNLPLISSTLINQNGQGHGDIFFDFKGQNYRYVFHTHYSKQELRPRKIAIIDVLFDNNNVRIKKESFRLLNSDLN